MRRKNNDAMSELLGLIYIMMIATTLISAIYVWAPQQLEDRRVAIRGESALNQFEAIEDVLHDVINQGVGSSKSVNFVAEKGYMHVKSVGTRFVFFYPKIHNFDFSVSCFDLSDSDKNFNYVQKKLPDYWDDLGNDDNKVTFDISYLNKGTTEEKSTDSIAYPKVAPSRIYFTDESSSGGSSITLWEWDFDYDGSFNAVLTEENPVNPVHEFTDTDGGVYTVALRVTNVEGQNPNIKTHDVVVGGSAIDLDDPHAAFSYSPINPTTADTIQFTDESTGDIISREWDFSYDENTFNSESTDQNPTHQYDGAGDYKIRLQLDSGSTSNLVQEHTITVSNGPPTAAFTYSPVSPISVSMSDLVVFNAEDSFDPDGPTTAPKGIADYQWCFDYDDGGDPEWAEAGDYTGAPSNPAYTSYTGVETYNVVLQVTGDAGKTDIVRHDVVVVNLGDSGIHAAFSCPIHAFAGQEIQFTDESIGATSWSWGFGDGPTLSTDKDPTHKYDAAGEYVVNLIVSDGTNPDDEIEHTIFVEDTEPTPSFSYGPSYEFPVVVNLDSDGEASSLSDAVQIDVKINEAIDGDPDDIREVVAGRIWLFDFGSITYETSSNDIARELIFQNGVHISSNQKNSYLITVPKIYESERYLQYDVDKEASVEINEFVMRVIQFKPENEKTIGPGKATYRFTMKLSENLIRNSSDEFIDRFKVQMFGDHATAWADSFKSQFGFKDLDSEEKTLFYEKEIQQDEEGGGSQQTGDILTEHRIVIVHSVIDVNVEVT